MERELDVISLEELNRKISRQEDFVLVETLAPSMYEQGHIQGAMNMPPDRIAELAPALLPDKNADIVVYCGGGG